MHTLATAEFLEALRHPHKLATRAEVTYEDEVIDTLQISEGNVSADVDGQTRRRCSVSLGTTDYVPREAATLLHPLSGHELKLYRGVEYEDGTKELIPLGVFGIEDVNIQDTGSELSIGVTGFDRAKVVQRARYTEPYFVTQGTNYVTAIRNLIEDRRPGTKFEITATSHTTPPMVFGTGGVTGGGDPWEDAEKMADAIGYEVYFRGSGICRIRPVPSLTSHHPVDTYAPGEAKILHVDRKITRENVFNGVIAFGLNTSTDQPVRVEAWDDDPSSPTYYLGDFGKVPTFYTSTMLLTEQQARDAAEARLREKLGTPEILQMTSIANPALEVGDVIEVLAERAGIDNRRFLIDKLNIPLNYESSMNITTRERRS